jgi:ELWxxDGT repeat protein
VRYRTARSCQKDITPNAGSNFAPDGLTAVDGTLLFSANDTIHGYELWSSDGTPDGTVLIQDINVGGADSNPSHFTRIGATIFFSAQASATGQELWAMEYQSYGVYLPLIHR